MNGAVVGDEYMEGGYSVLGLFGGIGCRPDNLQGARKTETTHKRVHHGKSRYIVM